jgi:co-chaperonin GroES (HSP10)
MINKSGLKPLGVAVLIEPYEPERNEGVIVIPDLVKDRTLMVEQRAIVVEVGPEAWSEEKQPRAQPGDKVMVTKMAGYMTVGPADGKTYRLVNDRDIFAAIVEEKAS